MTEVPALTALAAGPLSFDSPRVMPAYLSFVSGLSVEEPRSLWLESKLL